MAGPERIAVFAAVRMRNPLFPRHALIAASVAALLLSAVAPAAELPPEKQALLLLRALFFDRALPGRTEDAPVLVIAYRAGDAESEDTRRVLTVTVETLTKSLKVAGQPLKVAAVPYTDAAAFSARLRSLKPVALYVAPGLRGQVEELSALARSAKLLTLTGDEHLVLAGLSIGLIEQDARPQVVVNLRAAKSEGADLDSSFLRLARVLK